MAEILNLLQSLPWYVHIAIFLAAMMQAVTGIGFGLIAGPVLLIALADNAAIVASIILSLVTAVLLSPSNFRHADYPLLKHLTVGLVLGAPLGVLAFLAFGTATLKMLAAVAIAYMIAQATDHLPRSGFRRFNSRPIEYATGVLSGVLSTSLGMPGPAVAAYMTSGNRPRQSIRATTLTLFLIAYPIALVVQALLAGIEAQSIRSAAALLPVTTLGTVFGWLVSHRVSARLFRQLVIGMLAATLLGLLLSLLPGFP